MRDTFTIGKNVFGRTADRTRWTAMYFVPAWPPTVSGLYVMDDFGYLVGV